MQKLSIKTGGIKFLAGWITVFLIRLIPFRPPNVEPMLSVVMPFSKKYKLISSFMFGFLGIEIFDLILGRIGIWTAITALAYGLLGVGVYYFFKNRKSNTKNYVIFGVIGTILYDAVTGLIIGPLFFGQSFMVTLMGQIPFTINHLLGVIGFSIVLSPILHKWVVSNEVLEIPFVTKKLLGKSI